MSKAKAVILDYFRAVDACDIAAVLSSFAPDSEDERPGYPAIHGHQELRHFYEHDRVIASGQHVIERAIVEGNTGACWDRFMGHGRDGAAVDVRSPMCIRSRRARSRRDERTSMPRLCEGERR